MRNQSKNGDSVTRLLRKYNEGDKSAMEHLLPMVYDELCVIAHRYIRQERKGHTLDTEGLVHEAYARLLGGVQIEWKNRKHLYVVFARTMRRFLCDYARKYQAEKRGGGIGVLAATSLSKVCSEDVYATEVHINLILSIDKALEKLEARDPRLVKVVELRFYHGLTMTEIAKVLNRSTRSIKRDWQVARVMLNQYLSEEDESSALGFGEKNSLSD